MAALTEWKIARKPRKAGSGRPYRPQQFPGLECRLPRLLQHNGQLSMPPAAIVEASCVTEAPGLGLLIPTGCDLDTDKLMLSTGVASAAVACPPATAQPDSNDCLEPPRFALRAVHTHTCVASLANRRPRPAKGSGRIAQPRSYTLTFELPPPPPPPLAPPSVAAPSQGQAPSTDDAAVELPCKEEAQGELSAGSSRQHYAAMATPCHSVRARPEQTPALPHHTPVEGVPERFSTSSHSVGYKRSASAAGLPQTGGRLRASAVESPTCNFTPMEGVPERVLGKLINTPAMPAVPAAMVAGVLQAQLAHPLAQHQSACGVEEATSLQQAQPLGHENGCRAASLEPTAVDVGCVEVADMQEGAAQHYAIAASCEPITDPGVTAAQLAAEAAAAAAVAMRRLEELNRRSMEADRRASVSMALPTLDSPASTDPSNQTPAVVKVQNAAAAAAHAVHQAAMALGGPPSGALMQAPSWARPLKPAGVAPVLARSATLTPGLTPGAVPAAAAAGAESVFSMQRRQPMSGSQHQPTPVDALIRRAPSGALAFVSRTPSPLPSHMVQQVAMGAGAGLSGMATAGNAALSEATTPVHTWRANVADGPASQQGYAGSQPKGQQLQRQVPMPSAAASAAPKCRLAPPGASAPAAQHHHHEGDEAAGDAQLAAGGSWGLQQPARLAAVPDGHNDTQSPKQCIGRDVMEAEQHGSAEVGTVSHQPAAGRPQLAAVGGTGGDGFEHTQAAGTSGQHVEGHSPGAARHMHQDLDLDMDYETLGQGAGASGSNPAAEEVASLPEDPGIQQWQRGAERVAQRHSDQSIGAGGKQAGDARGLDTARNNAVSTSLSQREPKPTNGNEHERKMANGRKSLAGAGLEIDEELGVRRSTRARIPPLQYWRGEQKVYCRAHKTLPTVATITMRTPDPQWPRPTDKVEKAKRKARTKERAMEAK